MNDVLKPSAIAIVAQVLVAILFGLAAAILWDIYSRDKLVVQALQKVSEELISLNVCREKYGDALGKAVK